MTLVSHVGDCDGDECFVDELRLVQVQSNPPVYYEYVRPPWWVHAFVSLLILMKIGIILTLSSRLLRSDRVSFPVWV